MLSFSHEISWTRSWTKLSQFLGVFLPTLLNEIGLGSSEEKRVANADRK